MGAVLRLVTEAEAAPEAPAEARQRKRSRVMLSAVMTTGAAEIPAVIRDISSSGALITAPVAPEPGSWVTLRRDPICVHAQVVWREDKKLGLNFRDSVDEAALLISLGKRPASLG